MWYIILQLMGTCIHRLGRKNIGAEVLTQNLSEEYALTYKPNGVKFTSLLM